MNEFKNKVLNEKSGILFNDRKSLYSEFEFDYLQNMEKDYNIMRYGQNTYIFENKENKDRYWFELLSGRSDNQVYLKGIKLYKNEEAEILKHLKIN